jgi:hypothetical protein
MKMVKKFEITDVSGQAWIQVGETDGNEQIQIVITEAKPDAGRQRMVTGIVNLNYEQWHELCRCQYSLTIYAKKMEERPNEQYGKESE